MNEIQDIDSGKAELKDAYSSALGAKLKKKRGSLYESAGFEENVSDLEKAERETAKGLLGR